MILYVLFRVVLSAWRSFQKKTVKIAKYHERLFYIRLALPLRVAISRLDQGEDPFRVAISRLALAFRVVIFEPAATSIRTFVLVSRFQNFFAKITKYHEHPFYSCSHFSGWGSAWSFV
ncbi:MAG: hypothetical protein ACYSW6_09460 [Planctomycetota bacterium]|jgi:hypothetical protein